MQARGAWSRVLMESGDFADITQEETRVCVSLALQDKASSVGLSAALA
jgi:hypothetical protein